MTRTIVQTVVLRCDAYDCTNRRVKGSCMKFNRFPLQNKELCAKWITAIKRGDQFISTDYKYVDSVKLKDNTVPSIFKLHEHTKVIKTRKPPVKQIFVEVSSTLSEACSSH